MLPSIKNILYPTDLSKNSTFAFRYAITLAEALGAKITILYVLPMIDSAMEIPIIAQMGEEQYCMLREEKSRETIEKIRERLQRLSDEGQKDNRIQTDRVSSILVHEGDAADEILKTADKLNSDLIVLGAHGKGILSHTFLGSVSEKGAET
ncbi:MAG: universal stress protein [Deltaproteobacteria bacterium]|nr:universal stress protein [Deltaproteobacteria bacterium]MBW1962969.1 universal stress protein [Deltaproteobacteria bacterium]MBW1993294.1 universal stress protein [Deltaproteobacteria bacterium]